MCIHTHSTGLYTQISTHTHKHTQIDPHTKCAELTFELRRVPGLILLYLHNRLLRLRKRAFEFLSWKLVNKFN